MKPLKWKVVVLVLLIMIAAITVIASQALKPGASKESRGAVIACGK